VHLPFFPNKPEGISLWRLKLGTVGGQFSRLFVFVSARWLYRQSAVTNLTPVFPYTCCSECFIKARDCFRVVWIFDFLLFRNILWPSLLPPPFPSLLVCPLANMASTRTLLFAYSALWLSVDKHFLKVPSLFRSVLRIESTHQESTYVVFSTFAARGASP
jgi:hypothetical protein